MLLLKRHRHIYLDDTREIQEQIQIRRSPICALNEAMGFKWMINDSGSLIADWPRNGVLRTYYLHQSYPGFGTRIREKCFRPLIFKRGKSSISKNIWCLGGPWSSGQRTRFLSRWNKFEPCWHLFILLKWRK